MEAHRKGKESAAAAGVGTAAGGGVVAGVRVGGDSARACLRR